MKTFDKIISVFMTILIAIIINVLIAFWATIEIKNGVINAQRELIKLQQIKEDYILDLIKLKTGE